MTTAMSRVSHAMTFTVQYCPVMPKVKPAAAYLRLSIKREESASIAAQRQLVLQEAARRQLGTPIIYTDDGISGSKNVKRPGRDELERRLAAGEFSALIVKSIDRLARSTADFSRISLLCKATNTALVVTDMGLDTGTAHGQMMYSIMASLAQFESDNTGARMKASNAERLSQGRAIGGPSPYGFVNVKEPHGTFRQVHEGQAAVIRRIIGDLQEGHTYRSISRSLNADGVDAPMSKTGWTAAAIQRVLDQPALAGMVKRHGDVLRDRLTGMPLVSEAAILTVDEWYELQGLMTARGQKKATRLPLADRLLLDGLAHCAACGSRMKRALVAKRYLNYRCSSHHCTERGHISAKMLDDYVVKRFLRPMGWAPVVLTEKVMGDVDTDSLSFIKAQIDDTTAAMATASTEDLPGLFERLQALKKTQDAALSDATATRVSTRRVHTGQTWQQRWDAAPDDLVERRKDLERVILDVVVSKGSGPVESRVRVEMLDNDDILD